MAAFEPVPGCKPAVSEFARSWVLRHRLLIRVLLADVLHQLGEGLAVALHGFCSEGGENVGLIHVGRHGSLEAFCIFLHPRRCVAGDAVLPASNPQRCKRCSRATSVQWSRMPKSKLPSTGSICSHATGIRTVFTCTLAICGSELSACAAVPADEFPSSPPRIR